MCEAFGGCLTFFIHLKFVWQVNLVLGRSPILAVDTLMLRRTRDSFAVGQEGHFHEAEEGHF